MYKSVKLLPLIMAGAMVQLGYSAEADARTSRVEFGRYYSAGGGDSLQTDIPSGVDKVKVWISASSSGTASIYAGSRRIGTLSVRAKRQATKWFSGARNNYIRVALPRGGSYRVLIRPSYGEVATSALRHIRRLAPLAKYLSRMPKKVTFSAYYGGAKGFKTHHLGNLDYMARPWVLRLRYDLWNKLMLPYRFSLTQTAEAVEAFTHEMAHGYFASFTTASYSREAKRIWNYVLKLVRKKKTILTKYLQLKLASELLAYQTGWWVRQLYVAKRLKDDYRKRRRSTASVARDYEKKIKYLRYGKWSPTGLFEKEVTVSGKYYWRMRSNVMPGITGEFSKDIR